MIIGRKIGTPIQNGIPVCDVISMTIPSLYKEPRRVGGGEIGSEPRVFRGITHILSENDRRDAQSLWKIRSVSGANFNYWSYNNMRNNINDKPKSWKKKNTIPYYSINCDIFYKWTIVNPLDDIIVGVRVL
jgi:hypothetical protein